ILELRIGVMSAGTLFGSALALNDLQDIQNSGIKIKTVDKTRGVVVRSKDSAPTLVEEDKVEEGYIFQIGPYENSEELYFEAYTVTDNCRITWTHNFTTKTKNDQKKGVVYVIHSKEDHQIEFEVFVLTIPSSKDLIPKVIKAKMQIVVEDEEMFMSPVAIQFKDENTIKLPRIAIDSMQKSVTSISEFWGLAQDAEWIKEHKLKVKEETIASLVKTNSNYSDDAII
ncbi:MAG: hypothetical protein ACRCXZ_08135, partial [Patescibacteria group bacterium]